MLRWMIDKSIFCGKQSSRRMPQRGVSYSIELSNIPHYCVVRDLGERVPWNRSRF